MAMREMGTVSLVEALDYVVLLAELRPAKAPRAAVRWHGRLETRGPDAYAAGVSSCVGRAPRVVRRRPRGARTSPSTRKARPPDRHPADVGGPGRAIRTVRARALTQAPATVKAEA